MNILFIEPHLALCGGIRRIHEVANGLIRLGHNVDISVPNWVYESGQTGGWMEKLFNVIPEPDIAKKEYDIVIFNEETNYLIAKLARAKVRIYYALHWSVLHKDFNTIRNAYNGGFRIIANSNFVADAMLLETGSRPPVHHGGMDHKTFYPVEVTKEYDLATYGATRIWKGSYIADEVSDRLNLSLFKFGDKGVTQDKIAEAYSKARIFISTSFYEGWNWCGLESMACGTPLVISDDGGSGDYAIHGFNCLVFPARDIDKAADHVQTILKDPALAKELVKNGLATAKEYNWSNSVKEFESILIKIYG